MKNKVLLFIQVRLPVVVLICLVGLIFVTNYSPATWLSGWDNLHPEFNFRLNIERSLFAAWQEYQGLGLLGGMGHAADLPRQILLWAASIILPSSFIRYFYHFLMLLLGPLGIYFLVKNFVFKENEAKEKRIAGTIAAIFYLFNLATLQTFYLPYEAFSAHFAALPWLFLTSLNFLAKGDRKNLLIFAIVSILSTTQGYVATLFVIYVLGLSLTVGAYLIRHKSSLKRVLVLYLLIFVTNAFWLLPNLYFTVTSTNINTSAKINQMVTEKALLQNKKYGDLSDTMLFTSFWFDNTEADDNGDINQIMGSWVNHLKNPPIAALGYLLFLLGLLGTALAIKEKSRAIIFLPGFLFAFIILSNNTPVFSFLADAFYKLPLAAQIFRFPFTKFGIFAVFSLSIFYTAAYVTLTKNAKVEHFKPVATTLFLLLPIIFLYPVFTGKLFYEKEKATIPPEYFQTLQFFKNPDNDGRIANFPQQHFWGWNLYNWNYSGSGFLWYGIKNPILDRAFDPWSAKNENYYWKISYALYSQNQELFEKVLDKYQVSWVLVDKNIINPSSPRALYFDELEEMLASSKFNLAQTFGNIQIYKVNLETPPTNFIFLAQNLPSVGPIYNWSNLDTAYVERGNYISLPSSDLQLPTTYYPFRSLFTGKEQKDIEFKVEDDGDFFVLKSKITSQFKNYRVEIPKANVQDLLAFPQRAYMKGGYLYIHLPKPSGNLARNINPVKLELPSCAHSKDRVVELTSKNGTTCSVTVSLETLPHNVSYLITVKNQNVKGKPIVFWLENLNSRKADIETNLPKTKSLTQSFFVQPPMDPFGQGYSLHFDNISIGTEEVINTLGEIEIQPLPFDFLRSIKLVPPAAPPSVPNTITITNTIRSQAPLISNVSHPNPAFYQVTLDEVAPSTTLVLSQSFDKGWAAYEISSNLKSHSPQGDSRISNLQVLLAPILGREIKQHILVNNWANGWELDQSQAGLPAQAGKTIVIVYLPQYLEFAGFLLLLGFGVSLVAWKRKPTLPLQ